MIEIKAYLIGIIIGVVLSLIIFGIIWFYILDMDKEIISGDLIECISNRSTLYTQLGCRACEKQEDVFGDKFDSLNVVDCFYNVTLCSNISYTPTWLINDTYVVGVYTLEELKEMTRC